MLMRYQRDLHLLGLVCGVLAAADAMITHIAESDHEGMESLGYGFSG